MKKLELLKRIGKGALKLAGATGDGDKVRAIEAEKELLALKLQLATMALGELIDAVDVAQARGVTDRVDEDELAEARAAHDLLTTEG